jgi:predicted enzyme related to lactoylglutathione lyase
VGTRTEHAPGLFSWVDLTNNDAEGAKAFYGGLFGWEFEDSEIPGGGFYSMGKIDGERVAAIPPATDGVPPHWNSYVTVESADATAAKAEELGGTIVEPPFDVMEAGRMAVIQDPTGATLCVWEPREAIGAGRVNEPGCLTWNELYSPDPAAAVAFYEGLFGWSSEEMDTGEGNPAYSVLRNGDRMNGGAMQTQPAQPPSWLPYFVVEDRDAACARVEELGGKAWVRRDVGMGKIAILSDPQGAPFAVFEGETDD